MITMIVKNDSRFYGPMSDDKIKMMEAISKRRINSSGRYMYVYLLVDLANRWIVEYFHSPLVDLNEKPIDT